jgi:hypothetical protein
MIAESSSILHDNGSSKTKQGGYALKKLDLVQNASVVLEENVAQNVQKSVQIGGLIQASNRKQSAERRKLSNACGSYRTIVYRTVL